MRCIKPDPGDITVSIDLASGEPTVAGHFSQDKNYLYATYHGVGKKPFYENGILMIDDIYLMVMSVSPLGRDLIEELYKRSWPAGSFADQWVVDADVIKKEIKNERNFHKMWCLALAYSMQPRKMVKSAYENGHLVDFKTAKEFFKIYWMIFSGIRILADKLALQMDRDGYIVNQFGYRYTCESSKAYNYWNQSSVSGIMHVFTAKLAVAAPYAKFVTLIHDENILDIPENMVDQFRKDVKTATDSLNDDLAWTVRIRTGYAIGTNWYEAK